MGHPFLTKRGWTQVYLAEISGIGLVHIFQLENGRREAGLRALEMLAVSFEISVSELLKEVLDHLFRDTIMRLIDASVLEYKNCLPMLHRDSLSHACSDSKRVGYFFVHTRIKKEVAMIVGHLRHKV